MKWLLLIWVTGYGNYYAGISVTKFETETECHAAQTVAREFFVTIMNKKAECVPYKAP